MWAAWHVIPYWQAGHDSSWIAWQCLFTISFRVILVWLFNNTDKNLAAPVVCHASYNVAWSLLPNDGTQYDPMVTGIVTTVVAIAVALLWSPASLANSPIRRAASTKPREG